MYAVSYSSQAVGGPLHLGGAVVAGAIEDLALEIGEADDVGVRQADHPHPGRRQVHGRRRAQAAGADDQNPGRL